MLHLHTMFTDNKTYKSPAHYVAKLLIFAVVYFIAAKIGLLLATINENVSPFWPATGIAFALLFLCGEEYWPAIFMGAFVTNSLTRASLPTVLVITCGNTLQALVGNRILNFINGKKIQLGYHARTIGILAAALVGALISSTVGTSALCVSGSAHWEHFRTVWSTWFTGDALGGLIFFPVFLAFSKRISTDYKRKNPGLFSLLIIAVSGVFLCWLLFIRQEGSPFLFFIFPYLFWIVAVGGERGVTLATVFISVFGACSAHLGYGVFNHGTTNSNLLNFQLFMASIGIFSLMMTDLKRNYSLKQPALILFISWIVAGLFFFGLILRTSSETEKHFEEIVETVGPLLNAQLNLYYAALQSGTGLFAASHSVERNEWKEFLAHGDFEKQLPGIDGIGVIFDVPKKNLETFLKKTRADGAPDFTYHFLPNLTDEQIKNAKARPNAYIVTYIEPRNTNATKIGLDLASEDKRRIAAELARDTGEPAISERVKLVDDAKSEPAFLIYFPFYTKGPRPINLMERRKRILGWVYTPVKAEKFFSSVFKLGNFKALSYFITGNNQSLSPVAMSSDFGKLTESMKEERDLKVGNRIFHFVFKRSKQFYTNQDKFASWAGAVASLISILVGTFIVSLQIVKKNALALADKKSLELKSSEQLWKFALEGAGDSVWDWNLAEGRVTYSKNYEILLGYNPGEMDFGPGEWKKRIHPDDIDHVMKNIQSHWEEKTNYVSEHRLLCKDGHYKWVLSRGLVVERDDHNKPTRMVGTVSDITTWKQAELEIDRQRAKLHSIFEGSSDAITLSTEEGFIDCNKRALILFGYNSKEEFCSLHPSDVSPPFQPDGMDSKTKALLQIQKTYEEGVNRFEWIHKKKNGELFPVDVLLTSFNYDGRMVLHGSVRDITDSKQAEATLISQREKLMAAAKMSSLGEMAGGIAHEINNPLAIIIGKITQLKRRLVDQVDDLLVIENTAKRISAIIKGLSAFSRNAENDKMEKVLVPILIQDTLELSKERFRFSSIELKLVINKNDYEVYITGRASQLLQVLINLLNNAFDAVEKLEDKWVEIKVSSNNGICTISVTDSGRGIPQDILNKMMTPFFTTKEVGKGTGLGLSISRAIIEEHHGKLYYDTTSPNTRFVIELPSA
jgi:PAS domain S-box-containing protein